MLQKLKKSCFKMLKNGQKTIENPENGDGRRMVAQPTLSEGFSLKILENAKKMLQKLKKTARKLLKIQETEIILKSTYLV